MQEKKKNRVNAVGVLTGTVRVKQGKDVTIHTFRYGFVGHDIQSSEVDLLRQAARRHLRSEVLRHPEAFDVDDRSVVSYYASVKLLPFDYFLNAQAEEDSSSAADGATTAEGGAAVSEDNPEESAS